MMKNSALRDHESTRAMIESYSQAKIFAMVTSLIDHPDLHPLPGLRIKL